MDIRTLRKEAESGSCIAQSVLGLCYLEGFNVVIDYGEAFRFLSAAAVQGDARARAGLARMYAEGLSTAKDPIEAVRLYEQAAEAGEFLAQIELARIYARGVLIPVNTGRARKWYAAALAQEGGISAQEEFDEARAYLRSSF